jgi:acetolactate synthase small subunit
MNLMRGFGVKEIARTGRIAMTRGSNGAAPAKEEEQ